MEAHLLLWEAASDAADLAAAHRQLEHVRDHAAPEYRDSLTDNVRLYRNIATAWAEVVELTAYPEEAGLLAENGCPAPEVGIDWQDSDGAIIG